MLYYIPEDSARISYLVENGIQIKKGKVLAWFPKDSLSAKQMNGLLDTINMGIDAAEKFIEAPLAWQWRQTKEPYTIYFSIDTFISHAAGGYVAISFWRTKQGKAPWLHEVIHEMLNAKADDSIPIKEWKENMPQWLVEGLPEYVAREIYKQRSWSYYDIHRNKTHNNADSACKADLRNENGKSALTYIAKRGGMAELQGKDRRLYAPAFYHCSCSFVKYLSENKGIVPIINSFSASPYVQQELERSINSSLNIMKSAWLEKLQAQ